MFLNDTDTLALIYFSLLLYLQTREAAGITVMVYYAAVHGKKKKKKARLYIFKQPSVQASVAFIDDILMAFGGKRKLHALSWLSRWHLESIKCGLKDPIEAPLIIPSLSRTHTHIENTSHYFIYSLLLLPLPPTDVS